MNRNLHVSVFYQTKQSLVYDLQEPFRWLADMTVVEAFESGVLDLPDFYFTGFILLQIYFETEAEQRFIDLLREHCNGGVKYGGRVPKWDTVIELKTAESGRHLVGKSSRLDFSEPAPTLSRVDGRELREEILNLSNSDARRIGKKTCGFRSKS